MEEALRSKRTTPYLIDGGVYQDSNFGIVAIDWQRGHVTVRLHSLDGETVRPRTVQLDELQRD